MDYLYANAIINEIYRDISCSCPFPEKYRTAAIRNGSGDAFLSDVAIRNVMSFFSLKENDQTPLMVFSNVERHKKTASVGRFTQTAGWLWHGDMAWDGFQSIFRTKFYNEDEITGIGLNKESIGASFDRQQDLQEVPVELDCEVKSAILTCVMKRWLRRDPPVRIAVPKDVDYNSYVLSVMKAIYAYFPVAVRTEAGFCSYMPDAREASPRLYIGFVPEAMADSTTLFLNGTRRSAVYALNNGTGRNALDFFIKCLSEMEADQRLKFLEEIFQDVEGNGNSERISQITPRDYFSMGEALIMLTIQGTMEEQIPRWRAFYANRDRYTPKMGEKIKDQIRNTIILEAFCAYVSKVCQEKATVDEAIQELCGYKAFCEDMQSLADALWDMFVALMREKGMTERTLYNSTATHLTELAPIADEQKLCKLLAGYTAEEFESVKKIPAENQADIDSVRVKAVGLLDRVSGHETHEDLNKVAGDIRGYIAELDNKRSAIILEKFRNAFRDIKKKEAKTPGQINIQIGKAEELAREMGEENLTEALAGLKAEIQQYIDDKKAEMHSVGAYFLEIEQKLQAADKISYFAVREVMKVVDKKKLEPAQYQGILNFVERRIPADMISYAREFEKHYEEPLTLSALVKRDAFVCHAVVRDICDINKLTVAYDPHKNAKQLRSEILGAGFAAKKISGQCGVDVRFEGRSKDISWFGSVLMLSHTKNSMKDEKELGTVCLKLVEDSAYTGDQLVRCVKMFNECGLDVLSLFPYVLRGKFGGCTEKQYIDAFELMLESGFRKNQIISEMKTIVRSEPSVDETAKQAFKKFKEKHDESNGNNKKKWVIPVAIGAAVLVLAGIAAGIWLWNRNGDNDPEPTTEPTEASMPTEPAVIEFPPVLSGFAEHAEVAALLHNGTERKQFDVLHQEVSDMLLGLEQEVRDQALACYAGGQENVVELGENYGSAAWDEYFFWKCWLLKDADIPELQDAFTGSSCEEEKVLAVLRFIHSAVPAPAESDQTDAETEETVPEDAATDEDTTDTADTADVEEKSLTAEQMIGAVSEEAGAVYSRMEESSADMLRMLMLFGADFEKDFAEHQTRVEALLGRTEADVAQILARYGSLPGDAEIYFADSGIKITWSEYLFWECWLIAAREEQAITADVFDAQLHEDVVQILKVLYQLPDIELPVIDLPPVVAETEDPAETAETTQGEGASQDTVPPAEEETVAPAEEETETAEEPELPGAAEISAISEAAASAYEKARDRYLTIVDYIRTAG